MPVLVRNEEIYIGTSYVPDINTFQRSERHTDVTAYDLSEQWYIILYQATIPIKKTMKKFFCRAILTLDRIYLTYRAFTIKTLQVQWSCDMMNRR